MGAVCGNQEAMDLKIVRLVPTPAGWREEKPEPSLASGAVVVLDIYGSLLYAGSRTLQSHLPDPAGSRPAAVVIRHRVHTRQVGVVRLDLLSVGGGPDDLVAV